MPSVEAHDLAKKYPMAYFPSQSAVHPPAANTHVQTYYHTHDHVHITDPLFEQVLPGHPFVLSSKTAHADVVQEHTQAFQHGHIHYHIVEGTDPCELKGDNDCGDLTAIEEAVTLAEYNDAQAELQAALAEMGTYGR